MKYIVAIKPNYVKKNMTKQKKKMENACVKDKKAFLYIRIWMRKNTSSLIQKEKLGRNICLK